MKGSSKLIKRKLKQVRFTLSKPRVFAQLVIERSFQRELDLGASIRLFVEEQLQIRHMAAQRAAEQHAAMRMMAMQSAV
jgi:hypothetical protein